MRFLRTLLRPILRRFNAPAAESVPAAQRFKTPRQASSRCGRACGRNPAFGRTVRVASFHISTMLVNRRCNNREDIRGGARPVQKGVFAKPAANRAFAGRTGSIFRNSCENEAMQGVPRLVARISARALVGSGKIRHFRLRFVRRAGSKSARSAASRESHGVSRCSSGIPRPLRKIDGFFHCPPYAAAPACGEALKQWTPKTQLPQLYNNICLISPKHLAMPLLGSRKTEFSNRKSSREPFAQRP